MSDVERLFDEYVAEHRSGGEADPLPYLDRLEGRDRAVLAELIDGYLARAPRGEWNPQAYRGSDAERVVEGFERSAAGVSGLWPALLPRLRMRAKLKREELVGRLAEALGVPGREQKVGAYYHQMEQGLLPAAGVSDRVLEALATVVGQSAESLRRAGQALAPPKDEAAGEVAFARIATPDADYAGEATPPAERAAVPEEEWDEVDELFVGRRSSLP